MEKDAKDLDDEKKALQEACPYALFSIAELKAEARSRGSKVQIVVDPAR